MINVLTGVCHLYAYGRCCSKDQRQKFSEPSAQKLDPVIMKNTESIRDIKVSSPGVLTVVRLEPTSGQQRCIHSYYLNSAGLILESVNDPIAVEWKIASAKASANCPIGRKDVLQYNLAEIYMKREGANWSYAGQQIDFRYASESSVQKQWWA